ncbi:hypothetical protein ACA910_019348 [Epithemia clementina (nom. ined.)]
MSGNCETTDEPDPGSGDKVRRPEIGTWASRGWLSFLRPGKTRLQSRSSSGSPFDAGRKSLESTSTDDEEEETEPETDVCSEESPWYKTWIRARGFDDVQQSDQSSLEICTNSFGFLEPQSSDLTFPSHDDDDDNDVDCFFNHRDDVYLLRYNDLFSERDGNMNYDFSPFKRPEGLNGKRKLLDDDEVALLSARDDIDDRHISYNVDSIENTAALVLDELTLLELQRTAHEGEAAFNPNQESNIFPFSKHLISRTGSFIYSPNEPPMWSNELRRRLEIQKAYQQRLSYGGRNVKRSVKPNPHGELWTVCEGVSEDNETFFDW